MRASLARLSPEPQLALIRIQMWCLQIAGELFQDQYQQVTTGAAAAGLFC